MKKSRLLCLLLSTILVSSVLVTGCKSKDIKPTTEVAKLEKVNLKMYFPCQGGLQKDQAAVQAKVNEITESKITADLELAPIDWGAWSQKMPLILNSGEQADIVWTAPWTGFIENSNNKVFMPLDELLDKYGKDIKKTLPPALLKGPRIGGKLYAIPTNKELTQGSTAFFSKAMIDAAGADVSKVKYMEDLEPVFEKIKAKDPNVFPIWNGNKEIFYFPKMKMQEDSSIKTEAVENGGAFSYDLTNKKVMANIDAPWNLENYKLIRKWNEKGYINPDSLTNQTKAIDAVKSGKSLMFAYGNAQPGIKETAEVDAGMPLYSVTSTNIEIPTASTVASLLAIPTNSKNAERAMMAMNLLHSNANLITTINYGIEGKNYIKVNDNQYKLPDGAKNSADTGYGPGCAWEIGNMFLNPVLNTQPKDLWKQYEEFNKTGKEVYLLGFIFDTKGLETEWAAINAVNDQYDRILKTGAVKDVEKTLETQKTKVYASGAQKIKDAMQKQIEDWIKVNKK